MLKQCRIFIMGDVIGVGFRAWCKIQAKHFGVTGWVRNAQDHVETLIQGDEKQVGAMIAKLKEGSTVSRVEDVDVIFEELQELFESFEIAP